METAHISQTGKTPGTESAPSWKGRESKATIGKTGSETQPAG
jgi:hypothetical protein